MADVARYTGAHPNTVRAWFRGRPDRKGRGPILESDFGMVAGAFVVSFVDLIDVLVASRFRKLGVSMQEVRRAYGVLQGDLAVRHPFCHKHLYTDGARILIHTADELGSERLSEVVTKQQLFLVIKESLAHVQYSKLNLIAEAWRPSEGVIIRPGMNMGRPVIDNTGTSTYVVAQAYHANEQDLDLVGDLFDLTGDQVLNAVRFEQDLKRVA